MPRQKSKTRRIPLYDFTPAPDTLRQVQQTLKSGWLSPGRRIAEFESAIGKLTGARHAVATGSATAGLQLVLAAIGAQPGRRVITSPFTFVATIEAILSSGAVPVLADIDPATLTIDPEEVFRKVTPETLAVLPVDIGGCPADYPELNGVCDDYTLPLVADAAHSIGTRLKRKSIAGWCDAAVISFHATKNLVCGEGGMVLTKHKQLAAAVRLLANHGLDSSALERKRTNTWEYDAVYPGTKANLSELHAAVGLGELSRFEKNQAHRTRLAERYLAHLADFHELVELPPVKPGVTHGWHLFIMRLHLSRLSLTRDQFIRKMAERGVECGVHYKPIFELSYYRELLGLKAQHFPNAAYAGRRVVSLPLFAGLKLADVDYVCEQVVALLHTHRKSTRR